MFLRRVPPAVCIAYLVAWCGILTTFTRMWLRQYGRPRSWGLARRATLTAACCVGAFIWLWIDKRVEVAVLLQIYREHGVTVGDLLALPALALGAKTIYG